MIAVIVPLRQQKPRMKPFRLTFIHLRNLNQAVPGVNVLIVLYNINFANDKHLLTY